MLVHVQNDLFDVGADLATPVRPRPGVPAAARRGRTTSTASRQWCDHYNESLETLRSFILSGGTPAAAHLHVARTVVRRAERSGWAAHAEHADAMNPLALTYLNRLSDLLFILARHANRERGDVLWVPGASARTQRSSSTETDDDERRDADQAETEDRVSRRALAERVPARADLGDRHVRLDQRVDRGPGALERAVDEAGDQAEDPGARRRRGHGPPSPEPGRWWRARRRGPSRERSACRPRCPTDPSRTPSASGVTLATQRAASCQPARRRRVVGHAPRPRPGSRRGGSRAATHRGHRGW